jgi:hypothetical protein
MNRISRRVNTVTQGIQNSKKFLLTFFVAVIGLFTHTTITTAQTNCPDGINIYVPNGGTMIAIWSPLSNGDYRITRGNNAGPTHVGKDIYALDLSIPGSADKGKAVFLPITGRVFAVRNAGGFGNTVFVWDPGSGILIRLAHLLDFSMTINGANGGWFGAGTKVGYIGETGCYRCGEHLHLVAYRDVKAGIVTEQTIINELSSGKTPSVAKPQKFRLVAPSDNCDLVQFEGDPTIYTNKNYILYPVTLDVWRSWGLSLTLVPSEGTYDQVAGRIPIRVLPAYMRSSFNISNRLASPRNESVFRGNLYPDTYVWKSWQQKHWLNANQFCDAVWCEFRWSEVQWMDQSFVDRLYPVTVRRPR